DRGPRPLRRPAGHPAATTPSARRPAGTRATGEDPHATTRTARTARTARRPNAGIRPGST
ncbi:hypothetical protein, partial [Streptomyces sp. SID161]|uniref:hypothetical protein n=1 Tax=Streptomyces sp. SID161 TaxID=2690251 RepID=UPI001F215BB5